MIDKYIVKKLKSNITKVDINFYFIIFFIIKKCLLNNILTI